MTGFLLPQPVASQASTWALYDWRSVRQQSAPAAGGLATITGDLIDPAELWLVDRLVITTTSTSSTSFRIYDGSTDPAMLLDVTAAGNLNSADYPEGLLIRPASQWVAQWTGASAGAVGTLTVQATIFRRS